MHDECWLHGFASGAYGTLHNLFQVCVPFRQWAFLLLTLLPLPRQSSAEGRDVFFFFASSCL